MFRFILVKCMYVLVIMYVGMVNMYVVSKIKWRLYILADICGGES